jgi:polar amino acid transport system substrate-binding protein
MKKIFFIPFLILFFISNSYSSSLQKISLQLQWLDQFQFAGYYIAKEKGFYKDVGLEVNIKSFDQTISTIDEVTEYKSEYAIGRSSLLIKRSNGKKVIALATIFQSTPIILLARKDSNINSIKDIINKRIMLTDDALGTTSLRAMIMSKGVSFSQTKVMKHSLTLDDLIKLI